MTTLAPRPAGRAPGIDDALVARVRARLAGSGAPPTAAAIAGALRIEAGVAGDATVLAVLTALRADVTGAGPLDEVLRDTDVSDVLVNGPDEVWVDRGAGLERVPLSFPGEQAVRALAVRLAQRAGRRLDDASPCVDGRLPGGVRLHAVLPPLAPAGTLLCLRVARPRPFSLHGLVELGTMTPEVADCLSLVLRARLAFLVTGGTGTGKTTLLSTLLGLVDPAERLVLVEDSGELVPDHPHVVRLEARPPNSEGAGEVTLRDLVRQAMRMRPDRLVVGEVRGAEVVDLLAALNTGHDGGAGTIHANTAGDVPARVESLGLAAGLAPAAVHSQLVAGVHVIVHLERGPDGRRRVCEIAVVERAPDGRARVVPALSIDGRLVAGAARLNELFRARAGRTG